MNAPVYFDHNASSPIHEEVVEAMTAVMRCAGNASSVHAFGRLHRQRVEEARSEVAALVGAQPERVIFTSGGTEANNLAMRLAAGRKIFVSAIEHDSVLQAAETTGLLPVNSDGVVDLAGLPSGPGMISVMLANNETGVIQPIENIIQIIEEHDMLMHADAVQAAGRLPIDMNSLGVAMASLSAHKMGGPQGVGALVLGRDMPVAAQIRGGGQERGRRAGTENTAGIVGFGVAARLARERLADQTAIGAVRDHLEVGLRRALPDVTVFGEHVPRLANTSCFAIPGLRSETQIMALDLAGIAVSAGSACSSGKVTPSHVLQAMGVPEALAACAIRVSLGAENTVAETERLIAVLADLRARTGQNAA